MAALAKIALISVIVLAVLRRGGDGMTVCGDPGEWLCCGGVLLAPDFKPKLSMLLNIIVVGRTKILTPQLCWKTGQRGMQAFGDSSVRLLLILLVLSGDVEMNPGPANLSS